MTTKKSEPRDEYDFADAVRGRRAGQPDLVRELDPDLAERYPDSASVIAALRELEERRPSRETRSG